MKIIQQGIFLLFISVIFSVLQAQDFVIIANNSFTQASLSKRIIKKLYTGKTTDLENVVVAIPELKSAITKNFLDSIVEISVRKYNLVWIKQALAGGRTKPKTFKSEAALLQFVKDTPNALGFVSKGITTNGVKQITID